MADLTAWRIVQLCYLAVFSPARFAKAEEEDNARTDRNSPVPQPNRLDIIRRAYVSALVWTASAIAVGLFGALFWSPAHDSRAVAVSGSLGAGLLLWATLAVQGWNIQSFKGNTLSELVNRWWYRTLCWLGTALLAMASAWSFSL